MGLTLSYFEVGEFVNDMINFYGRHRFRCVYLRDVDDTDRVLHEFFETLVTLQMGRGRKNLFGWKGKG